MSADLARVDPGQMPEALCRACVGPMRVDGASVSLAGGPGVRAAWCASDRTAARLAQAQYALGDGPCQSALDGAATVEAADLTRGPDAHRWPEFAAEAVSLGVGAVFSLPLGVDGTTVGTLDLYRDRPGALSESDLRIARWTRDAVTFAVTDLPPGHEAVGVVMARLGLSPEQALDRIREAAFAEGRTVGELAHEIVLRGSGFGPEPGEGHVCPAPHR
ncbi:GAF and ANTAR domain-containing protein [Streptomyces sp. LaPpAH-108]|uniref:GAF and ANTAR domain-containing protein n=1 Tax=Streptomyces sp. LaPpAH-108 TaxID=1155714 RepID=UPI00037FF065|nr:GAF and ANTAR domain-containing protein [Streptomyces sp. LaPpAH-108]